jgi:3-mercaptopyruvate sulfurtransferase SseA
MKAVVGIVSLIFMVALFAGPASANPLVETKWLADNLSSVKVVFVDNWPSDKEQYMKKHIKGSV